MRRAFTMVEMLLAVLLVGVVTAFSVMVFGTVTGGWQAATDYMDKLQRTDFALDQIVSGLRSLYYPHDGKQDYDYGFVLVNNGDGEDPRGSDVIEWSKTGPAIVGNRAAVADTVHRVQVMVLEEGDSSYREPVSVTGLYARRCPDTALRPDSVDGRTTDFSLSNAEMYQPVLVADGIVGFNCRVLPDDTRKDKEADGSLFEDEWDASNAVPYKVELTFRIADREGRGYRTGAAPVMRIVRLPMFEQSRDGATTPTDDAKSAAANKGAATRPGNGRPPAGAPPAGGPPPGGGAP